MDARSRLAYLSPLPPKKTGIADYSQHFLTAIGKYWPSLAIDCFDDLASASISPGGVHVKPILPLLFEKRLRVNYKKFIYHIGNNPGFHAQIRYLCAIQPGTVVLHDTVLYFLMAGNGHGGLWRALGEDGIYAGLDVISEIESQSLSRDLLRFRFPEKYPLLHSILKHATEIVVHSQTAALNVLAAGYKRQIHIVPLLQYPHVMVSADTSFSNDTLERCYQEHENHNTFVIGMFGFGGETKRAKQLFAGLNALSSHLRGRIRLIIVGTSLYDRAVESSGLADRVASCGYVSSDDFARAMQMCQLVVNLRYPSMGETSAVQIQAMSAAKPTLVSDHGWFSELPDNTVCKIKTDETEVAHITDSVELLMSDDRYRDQLAQGARAHIERFHNPQAVISLWQDILADGS